MSLLLLNKRLLKPVIQVFLFVNILFFVSCDDDTVTTPREPNNTIDTIDKYYWKIDTINMLTYNFYVADSNNIYLQGSDFMIYYDGNTNTIVNFNDPNFGAGCIAGYDRNSVFIGGGWAQIGDTAVPVLKKWNGSGFDTYFVPNDTSYQVNNLLVLGSNEAWLSCSKYSVYHFHSGNFTQYRVDSLISFGTFFLDPYGQLYLFTTPGRNVNYSRNFAYKFDGNKFQLILMDTTSGHSEMGTLIYPCGEDVLRDGEITLFYFSSNKWENLLNISIAPWIVGGSSKNDITIYGSYSFPPYSTRIFVWDGTKLRIEKNFVPIDYTAVQGSYYITSKEGRVYINFNTYYGNNTLFVTGIPK